MLKWCQSINPLSLQHWNGTKAVVITLGAGFGAHGEGFFRISAFNSLANVQELCSRLEKL